MTLDLGHRRARDADRSCQWLGRVEREIVGVDLSTLRQDDGALDGILELADVARPSMREDLGPRRLGESIDRLVVVARETLEEVIR